VIDGNDFDWLEVLCFSLSAARKKPRMTAVFLPSELFATRASVSIGASKDFC
jgi:hypothetical protein